MFTVFVYEIITFPQLMETAEANLRNEALKLKKKSLESENNRFGEETFDTHTLVWFSNRNCTKR